MRVFVALAAQADSLSMSFLVLLERLTPVERAVFLLHGVFDYDFEGVAGIVVKTAATCRRHAVRARRFIAERRPRFDASETELDELLGRFLGAAERGDLQGSAPIVGADKVARMFAGLGRQMERLGTSFEPHRINGHPGVIFRGPRGGVMAVMAVMTFEVAGGRVSAIRSIVNPDNLTHLGPVEGLREVLDASSYIVRGRP
ncbi:MAG: hypothetical protein H0V73_10985 [Chloroflexi bacterium]|nr:hypothetical protein [Chloroflexota bacterium]